MENRLSLNNSGGILKNSSTYYENDEAPLDHVCKLLQRGSKPPAKKITISRNSTKLFAKINY